MKKLLSSLLLPFLAGSVHSFSSSPLTVIHHATTCHGVHPTLSRTRLSATLTRSDMIRNLLGASAAALLSSAAVHPIEMANAIPPQKSYSTNARNLDRLNAGDSSGGSVYDNNPSTPAARRRRAMQGCKVGSARAEEGSILGSGTKLSEKDCVSSSVLFWATQQHTHCQKY